MGKGRSWGIERSTEVDRTSGTTITRWTRYRGHSHHFYFTNPAWFDDGRRLVFASDRGDRPNLFSLDLHAGLIVQLTDLDPVPLPRELEFVRACFNHARDEACFFHDRDLRAVNVRTLHERTITRLPDRTIATMCNASCDGRHLFFSINEDLSDRFPVDLLRGYVGFEEYWAARPLSSVVRVDVDTGATDTIHEERCWIGHANTSPRHPHLLTFCHEGPWRKVDHRIWGLDASTGRSWRIRPCPDGSHVGHEYWYTDGETIGYHGRFHSGPMFGRCRFDDTGHVETACTGETGHIHSNDHTLIVGDGGGLIRLWRWEGDRYSAPRILCRHQSSSHIQQTHPHPRFTADGRTVFFTSDRSGYGSVYSVDVPGFDSLPPAPT